jgi:hypothetical protein
MSNAGGTTSTSPPARSKPQSRQASIHASMNSSRHLGRPEVAHLDVDAAMGLVRPAFISV